MLICWHRKVKTILGMVTGYVGLTVASQNGGKFGFSNLMNASNHEVFKFNSLYGILGTLKILMFNPDLNYLMYYD